MNKLSSISSLLQTSIMMSLNSENGNSIFLLASDMDVTEKTDPKQQQQAQDEEASSQRTSSKMMFSSSLSSSLFLQVLDNDEAPIKNNHAVASIKSAAIAAALESCVDLPEQDFDAELMQMTASFQKQMSVSSAASDDDEILHLRESKDSFLLDLDAFADKHRQQNTKERSEDSSATKSREQQQHRDVLLRSNSHATDTSFDSDSTPKACNNKAKEEEEEESVDDNGQDDRPFVFPELDCSSHASAAVEQDDDEVEIIAVKAPASPSPSVQETTSWVTPATTERRPFEIVNLKEKMDQEFAIHDNDDDLIPIPCEEYEQQQQGKTRYLPIVPATMMPPTPAMTVTTTGGGSGDFHDSLSKACDYPSEHHAAARYQHQLAQYRQSSFSSRSEHYPTEYYYDNGRQVECSPVGGMHHHHHPAEAGGTSMMLMTGSHSSPTASALPPSNEIQDVYMAAAERLRQSMQRSTMSRTAVVQPPAPANAALYHHHHHHHHHQTANTGALLRERMFRHDHHPAMVTPTNSSDSASAFFGPQMHYTDGTPVAFGTAPPQQQGQFFY